MTTTFLTEKESCICGMTSISCLAMLQRWFTVTNDQLKPPAAARFFIAWFAGNGKNLQWQQKISI